MITSEHWRRLRHTSGPRLAATALLDTACWVAVVALLLCTLVLKAWAGVLLTAACSYVCVERVICASSAKPPHHRTPVVELAPYLSAMAVRRLFRPGKLAQALPRLQQGLPRLFRYSEERMAHVSFH